MSSGGGCRRAPGYNINTGTRYVLWDGISSGEPPTFWDLIGFLPISHSPLDLDLWLEKQRKLDLHFIDQIIPSCVRKLKESTIVLDTDRTGMYRTRPIHQYSTARSCMFNFASERHGRHGNEERIAIFV